MCQLSLDDMRRMFHVDNIAQLLVNICSFKQENNFFTFKILLVIL